MTAKRIQAVALRYFAKKGYDATTLADIAGEIGIKKPSIYAHYPGKMELFLTIVEQIRNNYAALWHRELAATVGQSPADRLKLLFEGICAYFLHDKVQLEFFIRLWTFPPADCATQALDPLKMVHKEIFDEVAAIFQAGEATGLFRKQQENEMVHSYFCLLDGYLVRAICSPGYDYEKMLSAIAGSFVDSILNKADLASGGSFTLP